jgi:glycosyltransferase involved in cell wall biosynthesis
MRVLVTADPYLPVPPAGYGGIERVVALLVDELVRRRHDVTLVAHPGSRTRATLVPYGCPPHRGAFNRARELAQVGAAIWARRRDIDVIHSFGRLAALAPLLPHAVPKVQSYQRAIPWAGVERAARLAGASLQFTSCSAALSATADPRRHGTWHTVYNPVDTTRFEPRDDVAGDAPLVFLGRLEAVKGVGEAVAIARGAGRRLVIAGNRVDSADGRRYFDEVVGPAIDDRTVTWVGEVDDGRKNALLGTAAALLMPIRWDEPFGIVMIEALACGTPVIGFARGSVPEVIRDGETGFVCGGVEDAVQAAARLREISRRRCRREAEVRFGVGPIVDAYERVYAAARQAGARR